jgi:23S rRNA (adenine2030-N6)-methyltransferase
VLVDPPFERPDDDQRAADLVGAVLRRKSQAVLAIWTPLKDLETFDAFLRRLEGAAAASILVAEVRLRPLHNPLRMNGCAMIFINTSKNLPLLLEPALRWVADGAGEAGAQARLWSPRPV